MEEIWKEIDGFNGDYWVSNLGRVKSLKYKKERILKHGIVKGYERVVLWTNNSQKNYYIHRMVANAFIPNPDNLPQVNHRDENPSNNRVDNLEWCDGKYNVNYGTGNKKRGLSNTNGKLSKPVLQYSLDGTFIKEWKSTMDVQRNLGFANTHISECCRNIIKTAYRYIWKYKKEID